MNLLYPEFLWALLLNIVPIFIHLFNLQKHETIFFSDVSLLKSIEQKNKRKSELKNILLLISRMLLVSSIVIAFCFPYRKDDKLIDLANSSSIGIYIDNSFSMSRNNKNQSLLEAVKDDALKLIDNLPDKTKYVLTTNNKNENYQYAINKNEIKREIINIQHSPFNLRISDLMEIQKEQFNGKSINSFWFTDLQKNIFDLENKLINKKLGTINIIQYTSNSNNNISIDSVWFENSNREVNKNENLYIKINNHSNNEIEFQTRLKINTDEVLNQSFNKVKSKQVKIIKFIYAVNTKGIKNGEINIISPQSNDLRFDDKYYFSYTINDKFKVVNIHDGENKSNKSIQGLFESVEKTQFINIDIKNGYSSQDLNGDLIIINELSKISDKLINDLLKSNKKNNILFIPSLNKESRYNKLFKLINIKSSSLIKSKVDLDLESIDLNFFKNIFSNYNENLDLPYFKKYLIVDNSNSVKTLAKFNSGDPLLSKYLFRENQIYLLSSNLSLETSNFRNHALFVPIFLRIKEESSNDLIKQISIDNVKSIELKSNIQQNGKVQITNKVTDPTLSFFPLIRNNLGASYAYIENNIESTGQYYILNEDSIIDCFSINNVKSESKMTFFEKKEFINQLKNLDLENQIKYWNAKENNYPNVLINKNNNLEYWIYFIYLALIFLILEIIIIKNIS